MARFSKETKRKIKRALGFMFFAQPFIAILIYAVFMVANESLNEALKIYGIAFLAIGSIVLGGILVERNTP